MNRTATIGLVFAAGTLTLCVGRAAAWPVDCFTRGPVGSFTSCSGDLSFTHARPTNAGHFIAGPADSVNDATQCNGDWDGDGCVTNAISRPTSPVGSLEHPTLATSTRDVDCTAPSRGGCRGVSFHHWIPGWLLTRRQPSRRRRRRVRA
jgi:hypothetical protein